MATIKNAPVNNNIHAYPTSFALIIINILEIIFTLLANIIIIIIIITTTTTTTTTTATIQNSQLLKLENPKHNSQNKKSLKNR